MIRKSIAIAQTTMLLVTLAFAAPTVISLTPLKENNVSINPGDLNVNFVACDNGNGNAFTSTGHEIIVANNTDGAAAHTITITSVPDALGRSDTSLSAYSLPVSSFAAIFTSTLAGWRQPTGQIFISCNSNLVKFAILQTQH